MKQLTAVLAMAAVAGFALTTVAQDSTTRPSAMYGKVVSVDTASGKIVVATKDGQQVTVATDANTKIKVSDKDATLGDIKPDMGIRVSPATGTAVDIRTFTPQGTPATKPAAPSALYGKVVSVDTASGKVVVATKDGQQVTVATDANTKIRVSDKDATLGDVKPDMGIRVSPATGTAVDIRAFTPQGTPATKPAVPQAIYGTVVSVDTTGGKVVVGTKDGQQVTVATDANTKIRVSDKDATLGDVKPDMGIRVSPATGTAADIRAFTPQPPK